MTLRPKLRLMLFRDATYFLLMLGAFHLPSPFGLLVFAAGVFAGGKLTEPGIKADEARLDPGERRLYFGFTLALFVVLLALLLGWIIQHSSAPAWAMGSLGILVLLVLLYSSYDAVYGRNPKV